MNKKVLISGLLATATFAIAGMMVITHANPSLAGIFADPSEAEWHHYSQKAPTASEKGVREYWVQCGGAYQFEAPASGTIVDKGTAYDLSEFTADDPRYISFQYDENHLPLTEYAYGGNMWCVQLSDFKDWRIEYQENGYNCNLYSEGGKYLWRIDLPRIDYTRYPTVTMDVLAPNWYEQNMMGPEADQLTYHTNFGGNKNQGKIKLTMTGAGLHMEFNSLEYASQLAFENTFVDSDIIHGLKPAYFYTEDLYDRYLNIANITLSTVSTPVSVYSYAGDTSKLTVENGTIGLPGSVDYSIVSNGYATSETGLVVDGNANPGAAVFTLPAINFNQHTTTGCVSFKFGVRNNGEHMYFDSGDGKVDLGANSGASESTNNNGYVNWEMIIADGIAYVHNVNTGTNTIVTLTAGMRAGTESIVISGGNTSLYRRYLVCDFYWSLTPDFPLVAPNTPMDIYSYAGDTSKLSAVNGDVALPGSADYSIINNSYGTNDNSMAVSGNANPGAAVMTLQAFNMKPFAEVGKVTFKFGVKNNGEHMYFGSGDGKVDLGTNSPTSQSENNNGYVNWEMVITASGAYVHNVYEDHNYNVTVTAAMRNGTANIVLSGGGTSIWRVYFFTDFYWAAL